MNKRMTTERLTQAQLEAIGRRVRLVTAGGWRRANYAVYGGNHGITVANAPTKNDAEFIAHSRQDIPALLAEVERLNAEIADREAAHIELYRSYRKAVTEVKRLRNEYWGEESRSYDDYLSAKGGFLSI